MADRFKLITHTERQTKPVLNLVLAKAGKVGPQLQAHSRNESCTTPSTPQLPRADALPAAPSSTSGLRLPPIPCGSLGPAPASAPGRGRLAGRSVTIGRLAGFLMNPFTGVDRPVLDRTGLTGTFDFSVEWALEPDLAESPGSRLEDAGPTFLQAARAALSQTEIDQRSCRCARTGSRRASDRELNGLTRRAGVQRLKSLRRMTTQYPSIIHESDHSVPPPIPTDPQAR
jgi:uncharacterized protein (TIGR03435 family)